LKKKLNKLFNYSYKKAVDEPEVVDEDPCEQPPDSGPCNLVKRASFMTFI
jgi:hypothetical protein